MVALPYDPRDAISESWRSIYGVQEAGYEFGPQREFSGTAPTPPSEGVRVLKTNPSTAQAKAASERSTGFDSTDQIITVWAATLDVDYAWAPKPEDRILILDEDTGETTERWIIKSVESVLYGAQFVCYCKASPLNAT